MTLSTAAPPIPVADGSQPRAHIAALDGLRGLAVLAVLFFHAGKLQGGFLGVDLFFALSGFLITSLLLNEVDARGSVDVVRFWGRRFRRLLPAVLVLLVAVTILTTIFATVPERAATIDDGPWAQVYSPIGTPSPNIATTGHPSSCRGCSAICGASRSKSSSTSCGR